MKRNSITKIQLSDAEKKKMTEEIAAFYLDVRGEEIGVIQQQQILDLFMDELAPVIYDKALDDVKSWYKGQLDNMETDFYMLYKNI